VSPREAGEGGGEADVRVSDEPAQHRYVAHLGDEVVGVLEYVDRGDVVEATHTKVPDAHEGKGIAGQLVLGLLDRLRADGRRLRPTCPYVAAYVQRHPEHVDLLEDGAAASG
jgi:uncharacterized protein